MASTTMRYYYVPTDFTEVHEADLSPKEVETNSSWRWAVSVGILGTSKKQIEQRREQMLSMARELRGYNPTGSHAVLPAWTQRKGLIGNYQVVEVDNHHTRQHYPLRFSSHHTASRAAVRLYQLLEMPPADAILDVLAEHTHTQR